LADKGAELICVPAAFTFPTGAAHWEALLRARAIENQSYLIAPNQIGKNVYGFADYGNSMIIDPWGKILARAPDKEGLITAEIDRDYLQKVRRELPCLAHRRL
jgi:predicted amidohydrolase